MYCEPTQELFLLGILDPRQGASTPRQGVPYRRGKQFIVILRTFDLFSIIREFIF